MKPQPLALGKRGDALIRGSETLRLVAFRPTPNDRWTLGWGRSYGVKEGDTCTPEQAEKWYQEDTGVAVAAVNRLGLPLSQGMFDALVSIVYEAGAAVISPGHTIGDALRKRDWWAAWRGFSLWTKQAGKDLRGVGIRRAREMALFMEDPLPPAS